MSRSEIFERKKKVWHTGKSESVGVCYEKGVRWLRSGPHEYSRLWPVFEAGDDSKMFGMRLTCKYKIRQPAFKRPELTILFYAILFLLRMTIGQVIASNEILQDSLFSSDKWQKKDSTGSLSVLVTAQAQIAKEDSLELFGTKYRVWSSKSPRRPISEAIHATLADIIHLPPALSQDEQFICASSDLANPSYAHVKELPAIFPKGTELACFFNLGTGDATLLGITSGGSWREQAKNVWDAELVAQNLIAVCDGSRPWYIKLSVVTGADRYALKSTDDVTPVVNSLTIGYLEPTDVRMHLLEPTALW
ncbi:hypothetical protein DL96DRAFT_1563663 [Flagelloscypha sp. PMI_526]|nr:hypothetical protein DL96DRAFT_1563663 [Flagelloscypha sp. PMI_526]